jgi:hypothetical protein
MASVIADLRRLSEVIGPTALVPIHTSRARVSRSILQMSFAGQTADGGALNGGLALVFQVKRSNHEQSPLPNFFPAPRPEWTEDLSGSSPFDHRFGLDATDKDRISGVRSDFMLPDRD